MRAEPGWRKNGPRKWLASSEISGFRDCIFHANERKVWGSVQLFLWECMEINVT